MLHTPGPWTKDCDGDGEFAINADTGRSWKHIAVVKSNGEGSAVVSDEEAEANAQLIAAAPELLAVLVELVDSPNAKKNDLWDRVRAAVAKAEGK